MNREYYLESKAGRIFCRIYEMDGNAVPLIMIHGGPGATHDYLKPVAEELSANRTVILYDQLGCGKSDRNQDRSLWTLEYYTDELKEIREKMAGNGPVHLLGHSWGSMIAVNYLSGKPENVVSAVLSGPCLSSPRWEADQKRNLLKLDESDRETIRHCEESGRLDSSQYQEAMIKYYRRFLCILDPWPECMNETFSRMNPEIYSYMWGASEFTVTGTLKDIDLTSHLKEIKTPVLFTCGRYDEATPETTRYYSTCLPGSKVKVFEKASHSHHLERPAEYVKTVNDFMERHWAFLPEE